MTDPTTDTPSVSRADCRCCRDLGALPGDYVTNRLGRVVSQAVPGEVVKELCDECVSAAFLGGGSHPHSLTGARRALREAGFLLPGGS